MDNGRYWSSGCGNMERAQLYTLEGVIAAMLLLLSLLFVLQALVVTPQSVNGGSQEAISNQQALADTTLQSVNETTLRQAVTYWDSSDGFHCTPSDVKYYSGYADTSSCSPPNPDALPPNRLGEILNESIGTGYSYNLFVSTQDSSNNVVRQRMVYQGQPGSGAVRASRSILVFDDDSLLAEDGSDSGTQVKGNLYGSDSYPSSSMYNLLRVEVIVWRG